MLSTTPDICDQNPETVRVLEPLFTNLGGHRFFFGEVVTLKCFEDNSLVKEQAAQPGLGKVLVVDGGGSLRRALLGDQIAANAHANGWAGMVIFGAIRDVDVIREINLGVQALGVIPLRTQKRGLGDLNVPVSFAGQTLIPGQYIYADNNGILVADQALNLES